MAQVIESPVTTPRTSFRPQDEEIPLYRLVLIDDDDHTYDYVIEMLQKIFVFSFDQALDHAREVDAAGRTVLMTCQLGEAEFGRDQIHGFGPDPRMPRSKGPMSAVVEPAG